MQWNDIKDPTGEIEIRATFGGFVPTYSPKLIQDMINNNGVSGMVTVVNERMGILGKPQSLYLYKSEDGKKILMEAYKMPESNI